MNPFESAGRGYTDKRVLEYFSQAQKKSAQVREKALEGILGEIEELDLFSIEQCLYDTFPSICKNATEQIQESISGILLELYKKGYFTQIEGRVHLWLSLFLSHPDRLGKQLLLKLAKEKKLQDILEKNKKSFTKKESHQLILFSIHYRIIETLNCSFLEEVDISSEEELERIERIIIEAEKKQVEIEEIGIVKEFLKRVEEKIRRKAEEVGNKKEKYSKKIYDVKWCLYHLTEEKYSIDELLHELSFLSERVVLLLLRKNAEGFRGKEDLLSRLASFPPELLSLHSNLDVKRESLLEKIIKNNEPEKLEEIELKPEDFPHLNSIGESEKIERILKKLKEKEFEIPQVYEGLSEEKIIRRAALLNHKITEVAPSLVSSVSVEYIQKKNLFMEAVKVFPSEYFKQFMGLFRAEEEIYLCTFHSDLCTERTIEILFENEVFPEELLLSLPSSLHPRLIKELSSSSVHLIREVYEVVKKNISSDLEFAIMSLLYKEPDYRRMQFEKKYTVGHIGVSSEYALYLLERNAIDISSIYEYIVEESEKCKTGYLDIEDDLFVIEDVLSSSLPEQMHSMKIFPNLYDKWRKVLELLEKQEESIKVNTAKVFQEILRVEESIPRITEMSINKKIRKNTLFAQILRSIEFWSVLEKGKAPEMLEEAMNKVSSLVSTRAYSLYLEFLQGATISIDEKLFRDLIREFEEGKEGKEKSILAYIITRSVSSTNTRIEKNYLDVIYKKIMLSLLSLSPRVHSSLLINIPMDAQEIYGISFSHLSARAIEGIQGRMAYNIEKASLAIKTDDFWNAHISSSKRLNVYAPVLKVISQHYANSALNMYGLSQVEEGAVDAEVFYLMFDIPAISDPRKMDAFEWRLFLTICREIRSIPICSLISTMVRAECGWLSFLVRNESRNLEMLGLFSKSFPLLMRIFYENSKKKKEVRKYFSSYVTGQLIKEEVSRPLQGVSLYVKTIADTHIIVAIYKIEDSSIEVNIKFPQDYPLTLPEVNIISCAGIKKQKLQRLMLRIQMVLSEFCRVGEAMALWKVVLDQSVNEEEECGICFFLIDEVTKKFPEAICPHCSNKFHQSCLRRWMLKSKDLCPVCRAEIR
ncbi:hypothetical protein NEFER03_0036 [Nematocida sp. LUAm3]|nr:hypothetical protein NEFER03_0036 [Nematocida sp. LUAm3]KAI5176252.1 hypothetical protein NEFER02_2049 [Nematocida sp. LUAm2]KAI5176710.1 hypothetical protein NEFER01_0035 [Nematocida sp. LUAm1]